MRPFRYFPILILVAASMKGDGLPFRPFATLDLKAMVLANIGAASQSHRLGGFTIAQNHGRWAATVNIDERFHMILAGTLGTDKLMISSQLKSWADRVRIDDEGNIYTRLIASRAGTTEFSIRLPDFTLLSEYTVGEAQLEPVNTQSGVMWKRDRAFFNSRLHSHVRLQDNPDSLPKWQTPSLSAQRKFVFGLRSGEYLEFGSSSEQIDVFDSQGSRLGLAFASLDDAYKSLGRPIPKRDPVDGSSRVLWAALSKAEELYICLSGISVASGEYPVAVFDPTTGVLKRTLRLQLPTSNERISDYNRLGFIYPFEGAIGDYVVLLDGDVGLASFYKFESRQISSVN